MQANQAVHSNGASASASKSDVKNVQFLKEESSNRGPSGRRLDLSLQIPPRSIGFGTSRSGKGLLNSQSLSRSTTPSGGLFRVLSLKKKGVVSDCERSCLLTPESKTAPESPIMASIKSAFSWKRSTSLPVRPASNLSPTVSTPVSAKLPGESYKSNMQKDGSLPTVSRSLSVPMRNIVIVRSASFANGRDNATELADEITSAAPEAEEEEIPEEEAVCRICFDACEENNTLKMECSCKGALRLVHEECAVKWFTTKGNRNCDVCGLEVKNLPVTLHRVTSAIQNNNRREHNHQSSRSESISVWQDFVVLVLISIICYFFFLEQLLIRDMKTQAIVLAAPFGFTLGLLASIFAVVIAIKEYAWTYAALEFALVALTMHLFYSILHLKAIYSILLASVLGFGISMSINSLYMQYFAWRVSRDASPENSSPV